MGVLSFAKSVFGFIQQYRLFGVRGEVLLQIVSSILPSLKELHFSNKVYIQTINIKNLIFEKLTQERIYRCMHS